MTTMVLAVTLFIFLPLSGRLRRLSLFELVFTGIMVGGASVGRLIFTGIPSIQPSSFMIIITGMLAGRAAGYLAGVGTGLLSSILVGIGTYTPWQMLLWGLMGFFAGNFKRSGTLSLCLYGAAAGYLFGVVMNLWFYTAGFVPFTAASFLTACLSSAPFDMAHASVNFVLLAVFPLERVRRIYDDQVAER